MAKGLRSHIKQQHKTKLRNSVFAPVIDARTERLSKKLQEIAAQPKEAEMEDVNIIETGKAKEEDSRDTSREEEGDDDDMDIDEQERNKEKSTTSSSQRIHKKHRKKSAKKSINFKPHPMKVKAKKKNSSRR